MCLLTDLPAETILGIYSACSSVHDVLNLSQTCQRLHALLPPSQKLSVLLSVAEVHAGPIFDIVQLLTVNDVQAAHEIRQPSISYTLLRDILSVSRTAQEWQEIYPRKKWDDKYTDRRILNSAERYSLRRAIYRLWLYSRAFHNCNHPRDTRMHHTMITQRCRLLRAWSTEELAEIEDFRNIMRSVLDSTILGHDDLQWELGSAFPGQYHQRTGVSALASSAHLNFATTFKNAFHTSSDCRGFIHQDQADTHGWMDEITKFYILEDLMKLDPEQALWFREIVHLNMQVPDYIAPVGEEWFMNNGETFAETLEKVLSDRGENPEEIRSLIASGELGIARRIDHQHVEQIDL
jgi:hypothetical protein